MRIPVAILAISLCFSASAQSHHQHDHDHEIIFGSAGQLLSWCEQEARSYYAGQGITTYQWTGRHFEDGNTLHAEGKIRANGDDVPVTCLAAKGARERDATISFN